MPKTQRTTPQGDHAAQVPAGTNTKGGGGQSTSKQALPLQALPLSSAPGSQALLSSQPGRSGGTQAPLPVDRSDDDGADDDEGDEGDASAEEDEEDEEEKEDPALMQELANMAKRLRYSAGAKAKLKLKAARVRERESG